MSPLRIEFRYGSLYLPELGLWLDAHEPQTQRVFVSHAHSDHTALHREIIVSAPTARLMQARLGGGDSRREHVLKFGKSRQFTIGDSAFELTLLPAGHIFGSAMALIQANRERLLYTGDFKLRRGLSAEPCEPAVADILIMETTFGRPMYVFPPTDGVLKGIIRFCREALDNDETPVLLGYSLGKSQELLCSLGDAGLPLMLHGAIYKLTQVYEQFGQCFPKYERYEAGSARQKVLLCPPHVVNSAMLRNIGKTRTAILTGWAVDPDCRFRYQCDAAFPLSDHADFPDLLEMVKLVQPKKVYTVHGFAADFAQTLRELGYDAQALSEPEQLGLQLGIPGQNTAIMPNDISEASSPWPSPPSAFAEAPADKKEQREIQRPVRSGPLRSSPFAPPEGEQPHSTDVGADESSRRNASRFHAFAATCSRIAADSSKLAKIALVAEYLRGLDGEAAALATTWFSGRPFGSRENRVLQLGWAVLREALTAITGLSETDLAQVYLKHSDLGETALELFQTRQVEPTLTPDDIQKLLQALHAARGPLAKTPLLTRALEKCSALEAKYLVKIITGDLRIGLKEGLVEEAVAAAFQKPIEAVRRANLLVGDIGATARLAKADRLDAAELVPFQPVKLMLASPEPSAAEVWERISQDSESLPNDFPAVMSGPAAHGQMTGRHPTAVWVEDKYDGIRCQLHKVQRRVALYSRDLKDVTATFLELADEAREAAADFILDGEIVAMRGKEILPFSELQKRLGRRENDLFMRHEVPIRFVAFDLLWLDGKSQIDHPLRERRQKLEQVTLPPSFCLARIMQADSAEEIDAAFDAARGRDNEGLMIKDPESLYTPGRRGLAWLKLKKAIATLDCVVVGAEYGHGKRSKVLSDYTFAIRDETTGELKTIGKAYSGLTDAEIATLTEHFHARALRQHGRYFQVQPDTVLEIAFDRIQPSDRHSSGLALRFPRILRIRTDKTPEEIDTIASARKLLAYRNRVNPNPIP